MLRHPRPSLAQVLSRWPRFSGRSMGWMVMAGAALAGGCAPHGGAGAGGVAERDSAGIHIVENPAASVDHVLSTSLEPVLSIGTVDGAPEEQLFQVTAARRLSDGSVVVANAGSRDVRFYGSDGSLRKIFGGPGRGPQEFQYPAGLTVLPGDTILVQDFLDRVRLTSTGAFVDRRTTDRGYVAEVAGPGSLAEGGTWLPKGRFFTPAYPRETPGSAMPGPPVRPSMRLLVMDEATGQVDTLGEFGGTRQQLLDVGFGSRGLFPFTQPYAVSSQWAAGATDGTLLVTDSEHPGFHLFRGDRAHVLVRWEAEPEPLTAQEVEAWKDRTRGQPWARDKLSYLERGWAKMDMPTTKAFYGYRVALGTDGSVWLPSSAEVGADPAGFLVFTPEGRLRGRVEVPGPFQVMDAGPDWVMGIWKDDYGVEYLRMYSVDG